MPSEMTALCPEHLILGSRVHGTRYAHASNLVRDWAGQRASGHTCAVTIKHIMEARTECPLSSEFYLRQGRAKTVFLPNKPSNTLKTNDE